MRGTLQVLKCSIVILVAIFTLAACNRNPTVQAAREDQAAPAATPAEQDFMIKAAQANLAGIEMSRVVMQKTRNSDVKDFANMIQKDHTDALEDLADLM